MNKSDSSVRKIRYPDFAKRVATACDSHPLAPDRWGRQRWVRDRLQERTGVNVTPEAVRKWFAGEALPRPPMMQNLVKALEVDHAWLSLGINPGENPKQERERNALASGSVNLIAGMIQMAGGHIAFPNGSDPGVDLQAIIRAKSHRIQIKTARPFDGDTAHVAVDVGFETMIVVVVVPDPRPNQMRFLQLSSDLIKRRGKPKGGFVDLEIRRDGQRFYVGDEEVLTIRSFDEIGTM